MKQGFICRSLLALSSLSLAISLLAMSKQPDIDTGFGSYLDPNQEAGLVELYDFSGKQFIRPDSLHLIDIQNNTLIEASQQAKKTTGKLYQVYRSITNPSEVLAILGGVLVSFREQPEKQKLQALEAKYGIKLLSVAGAKQPTYFIQSQGGLATIALSSRLARSKDFASIVANSWIHTSFK